MTAEVAIINRSGIAVAADSAATIGRKRVWKSANKLFSMGPMHDIGVMFYGSADLFGCHWEIIIKEFRQEVSGLGFMKTEDLTIKLREYISEARWKDQRSAEIANAHLIALCIEDLKELLQYETAMEFRSAVRVQVQELVQALEQNSETPIFAKEVTRKSFSSQYRSLIKKFSEEILKQTIVKTVLDPIELYVFEYFRRSGCKSGFETGVVVFGYGNDEIYPSIYEFMVDGSCCDILRTWSLRSLDLNSSKQRGAIIPFAQTDVASLFMEGISSVYINFFMASFEGALSAKDDSFIKDYVPDASKVVEKQLRERENEKVMQELGKAFSSLRQRELIHPVIESIHTLPRDEMAAMAEAFIDLTSMRRKVDSHLDTVGGAIDVAVISKGEGLVWIKRKTYFDADKNPDYLERRRVRLTRKVE